MSRHMYADTILSSFRNAYYPRIAVIVDMIATDTDVKLIEYLIFMRDVRSNNYFEQMKSHGTRTLERKPTVSMKELMMNVTLGDRSEDALTSLANRIVRLGNQMGTREHNKYTEVVGATARTIAKNLWNSFDSDVIKDATSQKCSNMPT